MRITESQREAFHPQLESGFLDRLTAHVASRDFPSAQRLDPVELRRRVRVGRDRARSHGISAEWAIATFVALMFAISPAFDQEPEIAVVLGDRSIEPDERMDLLASRVSAAGWDQASRISGTSIWEA